MNKAAQILFISIVFLLGPATAAAQTESREAGDVSFKLARGGKVSISNRSGDVTVQGWDRDTVEARAVDVETSERAPIQAIEATTSRIRLVISGGEARRHGRDVRVDVKVPRYADIELVESREGALSISDIEGSVTVGRGTGDVVINRVGALRLSRATGDTRITGVKGDCSVRSNTGSVTASGIAGVVDIAAASGEVIVRDAASDVRASSASGSIEIRCAKGRAEAGSASGSIILVGIGGDVDANTASGEVSFTGNIRAGGRYNLKSISGEVEMIVQPDAPGFTATLASYSGEIETAFPLTLDTPLRGGGLNRRIIGRYGDGSAQINIDSFSGSARIAKRASAAIDGCKQ